MDYTGCIYIWPVPRKSVSNFVMTFFENDYFFQMTIILNIFCIFIFRKNHTEFLLHEKFMKINKNINVTTPRFINSPSQDLNILKIIHFLNFQKYFNWIVSNTLLITILE